MLKRYKHIVIQQPERVRLMMAVAKTVESLLPKDEAEAEWMLKDYLPSPGRELAIKAVQQIRGSLQSTFVLALYEMCKELDGPEGAHGPGTDKFLQGLNVRLIVGPGLTMVKAIRLFAERTPTLEMDAVMADKESYAQFLANCVLEILKPSRQPVAKAGPAEEDTAPSKASPGKPTT